MADEQLAFDWAMQAGPPPVQFLAGATALANRMRKLAAQRIYIGTSSWKYPGWLGRIYNLERYQSRGRFSARKFNDECLAEYAAVFPTVCGDFAFYQFPTAEAWAKTFAQVPDEFRFALKVPEDITVERFPRLPRYGNRAGTENGHFLDASIVRDQLLDLLEPYRQKLGPLVFQFGTFHHGPMRDPRQFTRRLDQMLSQLPVERLDMAVEVRNPEFLQPDSPYLNCLREHRVAHCFNSWTRMPTIAEQVRLERTFTAPHAVARFLLKPGRNYQEAVEQFAPYERIQDPYPEGRAELTDLIRARLPDRRTLFAFVNNRFEGNAIETIDLATGEFLG